MANIAENCDRNIATLGVIGNNSMEMFIDSSYQLANKCIIY
jgi:hypothetical protein